MVVRRAQASIARGVDELFGALALGRSARSRARSSAESLDHGARMEALERLAALHASAPYDAPPEAFFGAAGEPGPMREVRVRSLGDAGEVVDLSWRSGYEPASRDDAVRARHLDRRANHVAHARLWRHAGRPRPTALLIHGYLGGAYAVEERAWPMRWMFERLGLDLALPVLPFHGPRGERGRRPALPASDPRLTVEGFRQAIWDLVTLRRELSRRGAPAVGVMGMSLGGYTSALMMTVDDALAFGAPIIPLASIADFARDAGRLVGAPDERAAQHAALEAAHRPISPLARPSRLAAERVVVVAGRADRITPAAHAERLAAHLGAPLTVFHGGHLLQFGRRDGFREIARMLARLELTAPRA